MKKIVYLISFAFLVTLFLSSCNDTTYATELKNEKILIADFIKRNNINVIKTLPEDSTVWNENDYYLNEDGLYFHLVNVGTGAKIELNNIVVPRFIQYTLKEPTQADTISNWTTIDFPYPTTFNYGDYTQSCTAFHEAVSYMNRNGAEAKIIVPSKIGFKEYWTPATPLGYDIKIKFQQ